jgi:preprotein translocase subunit SecF
MKIFPLNLIPYNSRIDFMRMRWVSTAIFALLTLASLGMMVGNTFPGGRYDPQGTFNYALDFTGGTSVELRFARAADVDDVRSRVAQAGFGNAQVQTFGSGNDLLVRLQPRPGTAQTDTAETAAEVVRAASVPGNPAQLMSSGYVGPQIGRELAENGLYAFLFVLVGFGIYISFRFEWKFALAATATTIADVLIVAGWFAITRHEFDLTVLAGILSVLGYSINDKIVVFDRVRENFRAMRAAPREVLNASINQTLSRTVIVSFVAFLTVLALYLYGGGSLKGMAEAQMIGIVLGTLSSIFVACPLLLWLGVTKQDLMPKARDEAALARRP